MRFPTITVELKKPRPLLARLMNTYPKLRFSQAVMLVENNPQLQSLTDDEISKKVNAVICRKELAI